MREDGLDFVLFLIVNDVRRWRREGGAIWFSGAIRRQEGCMEYVVYPPCGGKSEFVGEGR